MFENEIETQRSHWLAGIARRATTLTYLQKYGLDLIGRESATAPRREDQEGHQPKRAFNSLHPAFRSRWAPERQLWGGLSTPKRPARVNVGTGRA